MLCYLALGYMELMEMLEGSEQINRKIKLIEETIKSGEISIYDASTVVNQQNSVDSLMRKAMKYKEIK